MSKHSKNPKEGLHHPLPLVHIPRLGCDFNLWLYIRELRAKVYSNRSTRQWAHCSLNGLTEPEKIPTTCISCCLQLKYVDVWGPHSTKVCYNWARIDNWLDPNDLKCSPFGGIGNGSRLTSRVPAVRPSPRKNKWLLTETQDVFDFSFWRAWNNCIWNRTKNHLCSDSLMQVSSKTATETLKYRWINTFLVIF